MPEIAPVLVAALLPCFEAAASGEAVSASLGELPPGVSVRILWQATDALLSPDAALFRARTQQGTWLEFGPEIVVEVVSPLNSPAEIAYKR